MTRLHTHLAVLISAIFISFISYAQPSSTFDSDVESWLTVCDGSCSAPTISWASSSGNPGGCASGTDVSTGTWYFRSPAEFNTDLSGYYGCNLTFNLKQNTLTFQFNAEDVIIIRGSDGARICYNTSSNPGTTWTAYTVPLTETGWKYNNLSGSSVTAADMTSWLSDVNRIWIRAEYSGLTYETDWIDNVLVDCSSVILPVELYTFDASEQESNVAQISWTTLTETNCSGFQIEKSITGGLVYDSIGFIEGNGTTIQAHEYAFIDDNFTSPAYYRLKQTDYNGSITYSNIISLIPKEEATITTTVFPNPAYEFAYIESSSRTKYFDAVEVSDMFGKIVLRTTDFAHTYPVQATVDVSRLPVGLYLVTLVSAQGSETQPIQIIQK